ncbi:MAG: hypothetical protein J0G29_02055 [Alphaproteobacteria bacterium]|nr:hypothetical protein [Alphaproteobacteria bacterium]OJV45228.1 MAG: hypothetical protein BGO28_00285 [Alphaproteobacteria bacterium 43-37]
MAKSIKASKLKVVKATKKHAIELAPNLKQADLEEIAAASGRDCLDSAPTGLLIQSIAISKIAYSMIYQNKDGSKEVIALGGVAPHPTDPQIGIPWAFTSDKVRTYPKNFMVKARQALNEFCAHFPTLTNYVYSQNTTAIRWLKELGFEVSQSGEKYSTKQNGFLSFIGHGFR